jgi:hypothetical protein
VAGIDARKESRPERTLEAFVLPLSFQDMIQNRNKPATLWLANFLCRFATATRFFRVASALASRRASVHADFVSPRYL